MSKNTSQKSKPGTNSLSGRQQSFPANTSESCSICTCLSNTCI